MFGLVRFSLLTLIKIISWIFFEPLWFVKLINLDKNFLLKLCLSWFAWANLNNFADFLIKIMFCFVWFGWPNLNIFADFLMKIMFGLVCLGKLE